MQPDGSMTKTRAINYAMLETGFGRRIIENTIDDLERKGLIKVTPHPVDKRLLVISREDIQTLIKALKGELATE